jgi:hypothetical protein
MEFRFMEFRFMGIPFKVKAWLLGSRYQWESILQSLCVFCMDRR